MRIAARRSGALAFAIAVFTLLLWVASAAFAAPADETMSLTELQAKLDAGTVTGEMRTVLKGSAIDTIPVEVKAISGSPSSDDALVMFEASGPKIDSIGGIASGMSGSPIYVDGKVIGAVSYGNYFTKGGTGLATPIGEMLKVKSDYAPDFVTLKKPLLTSSGVIKSVVIAPNPAAYSVQAKQGAFVAVPLASIFIGGLDPRSSGYKGFAKALERRGMNVVKLDSALSGTPALGEASFETTIEPGAAVAVMQARGDWWAGGVGTVTYTDDDQMLAFGHPAWWAGATNMYMANAWIDGIWPSAEAPYKLARAEALRGTIVEDRKAGVLGVTGSFPAETTMTATAVNGDRHKTATSTVLMCRELIDNGDWYAGLGIDPLMAATGVYGPGDKVVDAWPCPGSAQTTTTITAKDDSGTYTVALRNRFDSGDDIPYAIVQDAVDAIDKLQQSNDDGVHDFDLLSVDLQSSITSKRNWAKIVGVQLPKGLQVGANPVKVQFLAYGQAATQTVDAVLAVPKGVALNGGTVVASSQDSANDYEEFYGEIGFASSGESIRGGLPQVVEELNSKSANNVISLMYYSAQSTSDEPSAVSTVAADWVFSQSASTAVTRISARALPSTIVYGGQPYIEGALLSITRDSTVAVYATPAGGTESYVGTVAARMVTEEAYGEEGPYSYGSPVFQVMMPPATANTTYRIHYAGSGQNSGAEAFVGVRVQAIVDLVSSARSVKNGRKVTLRAYAVPGSTAGGKVVFERYIPRRGWRTIVTQTLVGTDVGTAAIRWKVPKGTHKLRVRYLGGTLNAAASSRAIAVTGRR
jgi:hypothetical protein